MDNSNICTEYADKIKIYAGTCALVGGILNLIFFKRITSGIIIGFGIGAGYSHNYMMNYLKNIYKF